jgi:hypothetical protein
MLERKLTIVTKTSWVPFDIQISNMHVVEEHSTNASYICFTELLFTNARRTSMKTFLHGKLTHGHN